MFTAIFAVSSTACKDQEHVGFIGLGNMGNHMARNLLKKGYQVTVFDVADSSVNALKQDGAHVGTSPADVAAKTKKIVTMLPSSPHVSGEFSEKMFPKF